jgi:hypothetical protein
MNATKLIAALAALTFVAATATDASAKHKRHKVRHAVPSYAAVPASPYMGTARPPWAQPWECFTDEGYGRYRPCSAGRSR